jgi:hypothetical protein
MNRAIAGLVGVGLLLILTAVPFATQAVPSKTDYLVKVTSGVSGKDVRFQGAFLLRGQDVAFRTVSEMTPFEFRSNGQALSALFKAREPGTKIRIDLQATQDGKIVRTSAATGTGVVVTDNVVQEATGFISSF